MEARYFDYKITRPDQPYETITNLINLKEYLALPFLKMTAVLGFDTQCTAIWLPMTHITLVTSSGFSQGK